MMSKLQEKPLALKREHPALQKLKFMNFFFLPFLFVIFALLDLDPIFPFCEIVKWSWLRLGSHSAQPVPQRALRHLCGDLHRAVHPRYRGPLSQLCVLHHPTLLHHILNCCTPRSDRTYHILTTTVQENRVLEGFFCIIFQRTRNVQPLFRDTFLCIFFH